MLKKSNIYWETFKFDGILPHCSLFYFLSEMPTLSACFITSHPLNKPESLSRLGHTGHNYHFFSRALFNSLRVFFKVKKLYEAIWTVWFSTSQLAPCLQLFSPPSFHRISTANQSFNHLIGRPFVSQFQGFIAKTTWIFWTVSSFPVSPGTVCRR